MWCINYTHAQTLLGNRIESGQSAIESLRGEMNGSGSDNIHDSDSSMYLEKPYFSSAALLLVLLIPFFVTFILLCIVLRRLR